MLNDDKWHFLTTSLDRATNTVWVYLDGIFIRTIDTSNIKSVISGKPVIIGNDGYLGSIYPCPYAGLLDDVQVMSIRYPSNQKCLPFQCSPFLDLMS